MTLYEKKAAKIAELKELQPKIEEGDPEAVKAGETLADAIESIDASIKAAERANGILSTIGNDDADSNNGDTDAEEKAPAKSLGENFVKSAKKGF